MTSALSGKKNQRISSSDSESEDFLNLEKIGECAICTEIITGHVMVCPLGCDPSLCTGCIGKFDKETCPFCQGHVKKSQYLRNRLAEETIVSRIEAARRGFCIKHEIDKIYFCKTCLKSLCPECVFERHADHERGLLTKMYSECKARVDAELAKITVKKEETNEAYLIKESEIKARHHQYDQNNAQESQFWDYLYRANAY